VSTTSAEQKQRIQEARCRLCVESPRPPFLGFVLADPKRRGLRGELKLFLARRAGRPHKGVWYDVPDQERNLDDPPSAVLRMRPGSRVVVVEVIRWPVEVTCPRGHRFTLTRKDLNAAREDWLGGSNPFYLPPHS
jgi:hypothetical protein